MSTAIIVGSKITLTTERGDNEVLFYALFNSTCYDVDNIVHCIGW